MNHSYDPATRLEVDHVIPRASGGPDYMSNLVTACFSCNSGKRHHALPTPEIKRLVLVENRAKRATQPRRELAFGTVRHGMEHISAPLGRVSSVIFGERAA